MFDEMFMLKVLQLVLKIQFFESYYGCFLFSWYFFIEVNLIKFDGLLNHANRNFVELIMVFAKLSEKLSNF